MSLPLGELAALATSLCWTASAFAFEAATRRIGPLAMNFVRVSVALVMLSLVETVLRGTPLPTDASAAQLGWLALSGLAGLVFGDLCLFRAYVELGARRAMMVQATAPIFAALLGWIFLGEAPRPRAAAGTALVLLGVFWAIRERTAGPALAAAAHGAGRVGRGIVLALGGALGQAGGLVLAKHGMRGYPPIAATQVRMMAGVLGFALVVTVASAWPRVRAAYAHRAAFSFTAVGALFGPVVGVSFSLAAVTYTQAGIASALMATQQIWMALASVLTGRERVGLGGLGGAVLAVAGIALLVAA
ncbi:MAG: DMT family transporter [Kofleriaceae bacterium]